VKGFLEIDIPAGLALFDPGQRQVGHIDTELETSLLAKVDASRRALEKNNPNDARVALNDRKARIDPVEAQTDRKIVSNSAAEIIERANAIAAALGEQADAERIEEAGVRTLTWSPARVSRTGADCRTALNARGKGASASAIE
jgi:hypothetical protein